jgi:hypothetical protein
MFVELSLQRGHHVSGLMWVCVEVLLEWWLAHLMICVQKVWRSSA